MKNEKYLGWVNGYRIESLSTNGQMIEIKTAYDIYAVEDANGNITTKKIDNEGTVLFEKTNAYELELDYVAKEGEFA